MPLRCQHGSGTETTCRLNPVSGTLRRPTVSGTHTSFGEYVDSIHNLAQLRKPMASTEWNKKLALCLDGEPSRVLREQMTPMEMRRQGAFFTSAKMARRLVNATFDRTSPHSTYFDPACGAGDLLLAIAAKLPVESTYADTLRVWGKRLGGRDIAAAFVRLAKARLSLLAAKRTGILPPLQPSVLAETFPNIRVADSLNASLRLENVDLIVMNPPFGYVTAPDDCAWSCGRVNHAALFVDQMIRDVSEGTQIAAILPDVLRSGSRYVEWRERMREKGEVIRETPLGLFDQWTDVDVYFFHFRKFLPPNRSCRKAWPAAKPTYGVGKRFKIHVGPVVPHRHGETGPLVRYIHARAIAPWEDCSDIKETRRFAGRLFSPPFVAVRRTSKPDTGHRAIATLVLGNKPVAVENHLVVLLPKDRTVQTCRRLIRRLRSTRTDVWLNSRLRCRHLTTRALAEMPWWQKP